MKYFGSNRWPTVMRRWCQPLNYLKAQPGYQLNSGLADQDAVKDSVSSSFFTERAEPEVIVSQAAFPAETVRHGASKCVKCVVVTVVGVVTNFSFKKLFHWSPKTSS